MGNGLLITVLIGLGSSLALLLIALSAGRDRPRRTWAWVIALVLLALSIAMRIALMIGLAQASRANGSEGGLGDALPVALGTVAVAVVSTSTVWRPMWSGWFLLASVLVIPALLGVIQLLIAEDPERAIPATALFATYSVPMLVISVLLILSGSSARTHGTVRVSESAMATSAGREVIT